MFLTIPLSKLANINSPDFYELITQSNQAWEEGCDTFLIRQKTLVTRKITTYLLLASEIKWEYLKNDEMLEMVLFNSFIFIGFFFIIVSLFRGLLLFLCSGTILVGLEERAYGVQRIEFISAACQASAYISRPSDENSFKGLRSTCENWHFPVLKDKY